MNIPPKGTGMPRNTGLGRKPLNGPQNLGARPPVFTPKTSSATIETPQFHPIQPLHTNVVEETGGISFQGVERNPSIENNDLNVQKTPSNDIHARRGSRKNSLNIADHLRKSDDKIYPIQQKPTSQENVDSPFGPASANTQHTSNIGLHADRHVDHSIENQSSSNADQGEDKDISSFAKQLNDFKSMRISYQAEMENYEDQEGSFSQNDDSQEDYSADHQGNSNNEISEQHNPRTQEKSDQHTDNVDPEGGLQNHHTQAHASGSQDPENTINIGSGEEAQHQQHSVPQNLSRKSSNTKNTMMNPFAIVQEETLEDSNLSRKGSKVLDEPPGTIHTDDPLLDAVHNAHVAADEKLEGSKTPFVTFNSVEVKRKLSENIKKVSNPYETPSFEPVTKVLSNHMPKAVNSDADDPKRATTDSASSNIQMKANKSDSFNVQEAHVELEDDDILVKLPASNSNEVGHDQHQQSSHKVEASDHKAFPGIGVVHNQGELQRIIEENSTLKLQLHQREMELHSRAHTDTNALLATKDEENKMIREQLKNTKAENRIMNDHLAKILHENASFKSRTETLIKNLQSEKEKLYKEISEEKTKTRQDYQERLNTVEAKVILLEAKNKSLEQQNKQLQHEFRKKKEQYDQLIQVKSRFDDIAISDDEDNTETDLFNRISKANPQNMSPERVIKSEPATEKFVPFKSPESKPYSRSRENKRYDEDTEPHADKEVVRIEEDHEHDQEDHSHRYKDKHDLSDRNRQNVQNGVGSQSKEHHEETSKPSIATAANKDQKVPENKEAKSSEDKATGPFNQQHHDEHHKHSSGNIESSHQAGKDVANQEPKNDTTSQFTKSDDNKSEREDPMPPSKQMSFDPSDSQENPPPSDSAKSHIAATNFMAPPKNHLSQLKKPVPSKPQQVKLTNQQNNLFANSKGPQQSSKASQESTNGGHFKEEWNPFGESETNDDNDHTLDAPQSTFNPFDTHDTNPFEMNEGQEFFDKINDSSRKEEETLNKQSPTFSSNKLSNDNKANPFSGEQSPTFASFAENKTTLAEKAQKSNQETQDQIAPPKKNQPLKVASNPKKPNVQPINTFASDPEAKAISPQQKPQSASKPLVLPKKALPTAQNLGGGAEDPSNFFEQFGVSTQKTSTNPFSNSSENGGLHKTVVNKKKVEPIQGNSFF